MNSATLIFLSLGLASLSAASSVEVHSTEDGVRFSENGRDILVYYRNPISRSDGQYKRGHYVHPLYDLDGVRMTDDMPKDHRQILKCGSQ